jgi:hypothetical protein
MSQLFLSGSKFEGFFFIVYIGIGVVAQLLKGREGDGITLTGLGLPHFCTCT